MRAPLIVGLLLVSTLAVAQEAPVPLPRERPVEAEAGAEATGAEAGTKAPQPEPAGERPVEAPPVGGAAPVPDGGQEAPLDRDHDEPAEPVRVYQAACPAVMMGLVEATVLPPITEDGCAEHNPLSVTGVLVNGRMVPVTGDVVTNCAMATTLPQWAADVDGYLWSHENLRIAEVNVGTTKMCRNVVGSSAEARLSEHSFANALDIIGFTLSDDRKITVAAGWNGGEPLGQSTLRYAHDAACSIFMTTLGPEANAAHADHFHIDYGCHGKTCTARLCE